MSVRLNINLADDSAADLRELARRHDVSVTEAVRRAISVYKFVDEQVTVKDRKLQIVDEDAQLVSEVLLVGH